MQMLLNLKNQKTGNTEEDSLNFVTFYHYFFAVEAMTAIGTLQRMIRERTPAVFKSTDDSDDQSGNVDSEVKGTEAAKKDNNEGITDVNKPLDDKEKIKEIINAFNDDENLVSSKEDKENYAKAIVKNQSKFAFVERFLSGSNMFDVEPKGDMLHIILNRDHPLI